MNILQSLQEQYDNSPYPHIPLEKSPQNDYNSLFMDNITTSYYLYQQKVVSGEEKLILDAGCGSGWTSLGLACANPTVKIIGIDLSSASVNIARARLNFHGFDNTEFYQLAIENISKLGYQFDYINCDNVLFLCDDPISILKTLKSVLKPKGIIKTNLHSYYQRLNFYRSQKLFQYIGLFDDNPDDLEVEAVKDTMNSLKDFVNLKIITWLANSKNMEKYTDDEAKQNILMNYLLKNDKGYTIPQTFEILSQSNLKFLSMINWQQWDILSLFKDSNNLSSVWQNFLNNASVEQKLHLFELLNPVYRLIDFWCIHDQSNIIKESLSSWSNDQWETAIIHLHPQLKLEKVKKDLLQSIRTQQPWQISQYITLPTLSVISIESSMGILLLSLWDKPQTLAELTQNWLKIQPINLITSETMTKDEAQQQVIETIIKLENCLYLLVEKR